MRGRNSRKTSSHSQLPAHHRRRPSEGWCVHPVQPGGSRTLLEYLRDLHTSEYDIAWITVTTVIWFMSKRRGRKTTTSSSTDRTASTARKLGRAMGHQDVPVKPANLWLVGTDRLAKIVRFYRTAAHRHVDRKWNPEIPHGVDINATTHLAIGFQQFFNTHR